MSKFGVAFELSNLDRILAFVFNKLWRAVGQTSGLRDVGLAG